MTPSSRIKRRRPPDGGEQRGSMHPKLLSTREMKGAIIRYKAECLRWEYSAIKVHQEENDRRD